MKRDYFVYFVLLLTLLTACSESLETVRSAPELADLDIVLKLPQSQSRAWDVEANDLKIQFSSVTVSILDASHQLIERKVVEVDENAELPLRFSIQGVKLSGTEWVELVANAEHPELADLSIEAIQASATKPGLSGAIYQGKGAVRSSTPKHYKASVNLAPVFARVELKGQIKYDPLMVASLSVEAVTPINYRLNYGAKAPFEPKTNNPGPLWENLSPEQYASLAEPEQVLAFHLFAEDTQGISIRIRAQAYQYLLDENGQPLKQTYVLPDQTWLEAYVLKAEATAEADLPEDTDLDSIFLLYEVYEPHKQFVLYSTSTQEENILALEGNLKETIQPKFKVIGSEASNGFFNLVNFRSQASGSALVDGGRYQAGKIYQIDLGQIDWNGDGEFTDADKYNPNLHGSGHKEPSQEGGIGANTKVKGWIVKGFNPHVE